MKLPRLNQKGIAHILAPLLFIVIFAGIGGYILMHSKAATVTDGGNSGSGGASQYAPVRTTLLPSCGRLELIRLIGKQVYPDDTIIHSAIDATFLVKKKDYITKFRPVFKIRNNKTGWSHSDKYTHPVFQGHLNNQVAFFFQVPIWVATADPGFNWTLDVFGKKYGIVKCHSKIKGYATTVCDAKTGRWRLVGFTQ